VPKNPSSHREPRPANPRPGRIYARAQWQRLRRLKLSRDPACEVPGCGKPATQVDHKRGIKAGGKKWSLDNLQSLCASCHSKKTVREEGGFGR
jgi:5-methylcytosine-specific restriction protein A